MPDATFRIVGALVMLATLYSIAATSFLLYSKFRKKGAGTKLQNGVWWSIEAIAAALALTLVFKFLTLQIGDRYSNGLAFYFMTVWFAPAITCGLISLFAKPQKRIVKP